MARSSTNWRSGGAVSTILYVFIYGTQHKLLYNYVDIFYCLWILVHILPILPKKRIGNKHLNLGLLSVGTHSRSAPHVSAIFESGFPRGMLCRC